MTMMSGLDTGDLDIMDEEFFGPPPRFLVEGNMSGNDTDMPSERLEGFGLLPGLGKIRALMVAW